MPHIHARAPLDVASSRKLQPTAVRYRPSIIMIAPWASQAREACRGYRSVFGMATRRMYCNACSLTSGGSSCRSGCCAPADAAPAGAAPTAAAPTPCRMTEWSSPRGDGCESGQLDDSGVGCARLGRLHTACLLSVSRMGRHDASDDGYAWGFKGSTLAVNTVVKQHF